MPKFLELFAGAGGMTMGFEAAGWECDGNHAADCPNRPADPAVLSNILATLRSHQ